MQTQQTTPTTSLKLGLNAFIGEWLMEGHQHDGPFGSAAPVVARECFDFLTGGAFIVHRMEGRLGDAALACLEVIGNGASHCYYSNGSERLWRITQKSPKVWVFSGKAGPLLLRCTTVFSDDGKWRHAKWEYADQDAWSVFWDTLAFKKS